MSLVVAPADQSQRDAALNPLRSVCVTAPAGSGKTELLTQRVLQLLSKTNQPEEILAITFTRKAAAEMHERIMLSLQSAIDTDEPEQEHRKKNWLLSKKVLQRNEQRQWNLLENPSRLKIQTIDSFCAGLTRQMPILSNFGGQPGVTEQADDLYQQAARNFLGYLETNSPYSDCLALLLQHLDNNFSRLERLFVFMLQRRDQWLMHIGLGRSPDKARELIEKTLQQIIIDVLKQLNCLLQPIAPELLPLLDYAGTNLKTEKNSSTIALLAGCVELPPVSINVVDQWQAIQDLLTTKDDNYRKTANKNIGFPTQTLDGDKALAKDYKQRFLLLIDHLKENDQLLDVFTQLRKLPSAEYSKQQWLLVQALTASLPGLVAELMLVFQQQGQVDHRQIAIAALSALGGEQAPSELALKLDYRLHHILVDEFQDTSSLQFRLLERLTEGWAEYNQENPEQPNTLFLVGDGMQSIYGFREASVGLFLEARKQGVNGVFLDDLLLNANFRSDPTVIDWVNRVFAISFPLSDNLSRGAVSYEQAIAFNQNNDAAKVTVEGFVGETSSYQEACRAVALVKERISENPEASVAILVRSRPHLYEIIPELSKAGITWQATDIDPLSDYAVIQDLLSLTKALLDISDKVSWSALLRSPWVGLNHRDLHVLLSTNSDKPVLSILKNWQSYPALSQFAQKRLSEFIHVIDFSWNQRYRLSPRSWIEGIWLALGGAAALQYEQEFSMVDDFFDLLEKFQQGDAIQSLPLFEDAVHALYAKPQSNNSNVHVMTIHKSKGLEFDTVILPGLSKVSRSDDKALLMWHEYLSETTNEAGLILSPLPAAGLDDATYEYLRYEQSQKNQLENTRLMYVAATRAINRLHCLFTANKDDRTDQPKPPAKGSLLSSIWNAIDGEVQWHESVVLETGQMDFSFVSGTDISLYRLKDNWKRPSWISTNPLEPYVYHGDTGSEDNTPDLTLDPLPQIVGTIVHGIFESIVENGLDHWLLMKSEDKHRWINALMHYHQLSKQYWDTVRQQIMTAVDKTIMNDKGRWLLDGQSSYSKAEYALTSCTSSQIKHRVIDRIVQGTDGVIWIVDYKTSQPQSGESRREFLEREIDMYYPQLADYKWHMQQLLGSDKPIKTALFFTCFPLWQELS